MSVALQSLIALLSLEQRDTHHFIGNSVDIGAGRIFGGQIMAQAVFAAMHTVNQNPAAPQRQLHSLHAYFLSMGDAYAPVEFIVTELRNGRSFAARDIKAMQNDKCILAMVASFQIGEQGFCHDTAYIPASIPTPDLLINEYQYFQQILDTLPEPMRARASVDKPIEIRPINPLHPAFPEKAPAQQAIWFRSNGALPADSILHTVLLIYSSDFKLCTTCLRPHGFAYSHPKMQVASIDHALWLHRPVQFDDWHLYMMQSPHAGNARGFNLGQIFNQQGELVASTAQEGLIRQRFDD